MLIQVVQDDPVSPRLLNPEVPVDLETICLKCLHKDAGRRYQSAGELADDLSRFLTGDPIRARPIGFIERRWRWCKRNPAVAALSATAIGLLFTVALVASVGLVRTQQALREREQAALTAGQVSDFLVDIFRSSDPIGWASGDNSAFVRRDPSAADITARELLDRAAKRIETKLADQPEIQATLLNTIGGVYRELGLYPEAVGFFQSALRKRSLLDQDDSHATASIKHNLGVALQHTGRFEESEKLLRSTLKLRRRTLGPDHLDTASTMQALAFLIATARNYDKEKCTEAVALMDDVIRIRVQQQGREHQGVGIALTVKAAVLLAQGDFAGAHPEVISALNIFSKQADGTLSLVEDALSNYQQGVVVGSQGDPETGAELLEKSLTTAHQVLSEEHPYVAFIMADYARALSASGDNHAAMEVAEKAANICERRMSQGHPLVLKLHRLIAWMHAETGRREEARRILLRVRRTSEETHGDDSAILAEALILVAELERMEGNLDVALQNAEQAVEILHELPSFGGRNIWWYRNELARCYLKKDKASAAIDVLLKPFPQVKSHPDDLLPGGAENVVSLHLLASAYKKVGDMNRATQLFGAAIKTLEKVAKPNLYYLAELKYSLAETLSEQGADEQARMEILASRETLNRDADIDDARREELINRLLALECRLELAQAQSAAGPP